MIRILYNAIYKRSIPCILLENIQNILVFSHYSTRSDNCPLIISPLIHTYKSGYSFAYVCTSSWFFFSISIISPNIFMSGLSCISTVESKFASIVFTNVEKVHSMCILIKSIYANQSALPK